MRQAVENVERAAVSSGEEAAKAIKAHLGGDEAASGVRWYTIRKLHDLDRAVRDGRVRHVLLGSLSDLLDGIWEHEIDIDAWIERGVQIELAPAAGEANSPAAQVSVLTLARGVNKSWQAWRARYRRRSLWTAGLITAFVLALCFVVNLLIAG